MPLQNLCFETFFFQMEFGYVSYDYIDPEDYADYEDIRNANRNEGG